MLKNLKMSAKMVLGFGIVIVLVVVIGGLAVLNMRSIATQSNSLRDEYVPQVSAANEVERQSLKTMYAMRGYVLSFDEKYYTESDTTLADVNKYLAEARTLADKYASLTELKKGVVTAEANVATYVKLRAETVTVIRSIAENRTKANDAATEFMKQCSDYLASQDESLQGEIAAKATPAKLTERVGKIATANEIVDIGNAIRIDNWKAQALVDYRIMEDGI
jgi:methyl-accepting chemotaxis protein